jgi:hypothetical protein
MADYDWFDREPTKWEIEANAKRPQGYAAVFNYSSISKINGIKYFLCRRGCGTLVWDTVAHSKNVCTTFEPVAGNNG